MAKTKTPFFGLGSQGTIGGFLTSQKRGSTTILREKPVPTDPYTLPQAYQRWLYEDYAYLWTQQSAATRQTYATAGSRYHLTGFQYWMKYQLTNLPDIAGYWPLDEPSGAIAHDRSRNANHGAIFGATPATGLIDGCYSFDGLNDWIDCGNDPSLNVYDELSIELFFKLTGTGLLVPFAKLTGVTGFQFYFDNTVNQIWFGGFIAGIGVRHTTVPYVQETSDWHHLVGRLTGNTLSIFLDNQQGTDNINAGPFVPSTCNLSIGSREFYATKRPFDGLIDQVVYHTKVLDIPTIQRHSERRYPS